LDISITAAIPDVRQMFFITRKLPVINGRNAGVELGARGLPKIDVFKVAL